MRAIWKGCLRCSLVTIPTVMFTASTKQPLQFHLHQRTCGSLIQPENDPPSLPLIEKPFSIARVKPELRGEVTLQDETPRGHFRAPAFIRLIE